MTTESKSTKEIWKPVNEFKGKYEVSSLGRVRSIDREVKFYSSKFNKEISYKREGIILVPVFVKGYWRVNLGKQRSIHRLVAKAFIDNPEKKPQVNHINGNPLDNRVENLEWCTPKENTQHAVRTGLKKGVKGGKNWHAKKVINTETGKVFGSITEAAISIDVKQTTLAAWLRGESKNRSNFQFVSND